MEDESLGYVMSVYVMIRIARKCPSNRDELEGCGNPLPRLVQQHAEDILAVVEASRRISMERDHSLHEDTRRTSRPAAVCSNFVCAARNHNR